jgi:hypothetical protein
MPNPNVPQFNIEVHIHGPLGQGGVEEILGQLDKLTKLVNQIGIVELGIAKTEIQMQQSTTDLISVVQSLVDNSSKVDDAIDKLVEAQNGGDTAAIAQAVTSLQGLKSDQDTHDTCNRSDTGRSLSPCRRLMISVRPSRISWRPSCLPRQN